MIFRENTILVRFFAFYYFGYFCVTDGYFTDFMIFGDYIAYPRYMVSRVFVVYGILKGLGETEVLVCFYAFGCFGFFGLWTDDLWIL